MSGDRSLGIGDLPVAGPVSSTDTLAICQSPTGCFASDASVTLRGVSQSQLATYYQSTFAGTAPITFGGGSIGLAIDQTLQVTNGQLGVAGSAGIPEAPTTGGPFGRQSAGWVPVLAAGVTIPVSGGGTGATSAPAALTSLGAAPILNPVFQGSPMAPTPSPGTSTDQLATTQFVADAIIAGGGIVVPNGPLLSGNGIELGVVSLGTGLSMAGGFPGQILNVSGFLPLSGGAMTGPITAAIPDATVQVPYIGGVAGPALRLGEATTGFHRAQAGNPASAVYLTIANTAIQVWDSAANMTLLAIDLSMTSSHRIHFLADPIDPQDAATKNYVDSRPGGGGGITGITAGTGIAVTPDPVSPTVALTLGTGGGLAVAFGGTNGTTQTTARTGLGLGTIATQNTPLGTAFGGTGSNSANFVVNSILMATGQTNALTVIPTAGVNTVLHGGAPPSYGLVNLGSDVVGTLPVASGGTGANVFAPGNLIGMGGAGTFVGVPTPIAVATGGTGAATFTPSGALLLGTGTAAVRASQLMTQTGDTVGLQMRSAGAAGSPYIDFYWASGTIGTPGPSQAGDNLGGVYAGGADSSGWSNGGECAIAFFANVNWTTVSHPTALTLGTTSPEATTPTVRINIREGVGIGVGTNDTGPGTLNVQNALYVSGIGAEPLAISWLAGIDPNNAVLVVAQRALRITNITAVIRVSNAGATLQIRRGDGTNMITAALDLGQVPGVYQLTPSITTVAANDFLYLATTGTFTTSVAHVTVAVA